MARAMAALPAATQPLATAVVARTAMDSAREFARSSALAAVRATEVATAIVELRIQIRATVAMGEVVMAPRPASARVARVAMVRR